MCVFAVVGYVEIWLGSCILYVTTALNAIAFFHIFLFFHSMKFSQLVFYFHIYFPHFLFSLPHTNLLLFVVPGLPNLVISSSFRCSDVNVRTAITNNVTAISLQYNVCFQ